MTKHDIEYKWEKVWLTKLRQIKKSEWVKSVSLKKDYWFSAKQIKEF